MIPNSSFRGKRVLVTGGAGFIGSHLVEALLKQGVLVRVLDSLVPQVHGKGNKDFPWPRGSVEFVKGDVADATTFKKVLSGVDAVLHHAAEVGVGQSMYEPLRYVRANTWGTILLINSLRLLRKKIKKLIIASSMSLYGEGVYQCFVHGRCHPTLRSVEQLKRRQWEMTCPECDQVLESCLTDEQAPLKPTSIYAITKRDQEEMSLSMGRAYAIPTVALRYFNVYGPRQALSNPYTGAMAIFCSRLMNGNPPLIFEDGLQSRDFVHVTDIVQANLLALGKPEANYQVFNVGTGQSTTLSEAAQLLARSMGLNITPKITQQFREGDIRHCAADISKIRRLLGYEPQVKFRQGIQNLLWWANNQKPEDKVETAWKELAEHGLAK